MTQSPKFSVIIPLYNKEPYITRAVRSVLAQNWQDYELLVVDDGSTDNGLRVLREQFQDPRVRLIVQENSGEGGARNRGIAEMRGDIAAFLDADDEWLPTHLDHIAELAIGFPQAGWFATGYRSMFRGGFMKETTLSSRQPLLVPDYFEIATGAFFLNISSTAVRKSVLNCTGGFSVGEPVGADLEFFGRLALRHTLAYHPVISGVYYKIIPNSVMRVAEWKCERPPVVRTLDSYQDALMSPAMRESVRRYADWVLSQWVLAGLCAGSGRKAMELLGGRRTSSRLLGKWTWRLVVVVRRLRMALVAHMVPSRTLNLLVRLRHSRWFVRKENRHGQVIKAVTSWHASGLFGRPAEHGAERC